MLICGRLWHFCREYKLKSKQEAAKGLRAGRPITSEDVGIRPQTIRIFYGSVRSAFAHFT